MLGYELVGAAIGVDIGNIVMIAQDVVDADVDVDAIVGVVYEFKCREC